MADKHIIQLSYQEQQNVTVVMQQPTPVTTTVRPNRRPEMGIAAMVFAIITTIFIASFGCWWSLPCTIIGIVLGVTVSWRGLHHTMLPPILQCHVLNLPFTDDGQVVIKRY